MTANEVKRLKVARVKCDNSLLFHTRFFFKTLKNQKFIINWHHSEICKALERVANYETIFLNINIPPRHSKTELAVNFISQNLGKNPHGNYLYITASDDLRSETSVKIRDIITSPEYANMYGVELKKDQNAKNLWRTKQGGGLKTATIFGQITGFGAGQMIEHNQDLEDYIRDFEGCIILDDINKIGDAAMFNANNDKANTRIFDTILSRKNSRDTPLINIQQRVGMEDATSSLLEYYKDDDNIENLVLPIIYEGKPLWEWKHTMDDILGMKNNPITKDIFQSQYMQDPKPIEGLMYGEFKTYSDLPEVGKLDYLNYTDTADTGDDYLCSISYIDTGHLKYVQDIVYTTEAMEETEVLTAELLIKCGTKKSKIESNNGGRGFARNVQGFEGNSITVKGKCVITWFHQTKNKETRIFTNRHMVTDQVVMPHDWYVRWPVFHQHVTRHLAKGKNKHDDAPDVLTGMVETKPTKRIRSRKS